MLYSNLNIQILAKVWKLLEKSSKSVFSSNGSSLEKSSLDFLWLDDLPWQWLIREKPFFFESLLLVRHLTLTARLVSFGTLSFSLTCGKILYCSCSSLIVLQFGSLPLKFLQLEASSPFWANLLWHLESLVDSSFPFEGKSPLALDLQFLGSNYRLIHRLINWKIYYCWQKIINSPVLYFGIDIN